jgi:hypothetical protein
MSDIAKKYQHYFNESVKLQKIVDEQSAYIAQLEEALAMNGNEEAAQAKLAAADTDMKDIMPGVKAKNRPMMKPKKPVDLSAEALRLKAEQEIEK